MRMCLHPSHLDPYNKEQVWILDGEPDHKHDDDAWLEIEEDTSWLNN